MWFRRRHRPKSELGSEGETYLEKTGVGGLPPISPARYAADDLANARPANAERNGATTPIDLHPRDRQGRPPEPDRGRLPTSTTGPSASGDINPAYNHLRTQIIQRLGENGWKTVAVTSPTRGSGTTLTAINLAISIARNFNYSVLLVELDLVNPSFRQVLGFEAHLGIVDHLLHDVPISEIVLDPGIDGLDVIPAGSPVINSSGLLSSAKMIRLVDELKHRYNYQVILFDLPSVLSFDDAMAFSPFVDCALLVVAEGETKINDVRRALDYLRSTKILGVVLNRSINVMND